MEIDQIAVVILAAGESSRFGSQKMDYRLDNGKTILESCVEQYQRVFSNITVIVNDANTNQRVINLGVNVVTVNQADKGMSQSLIAGIKSQENAKGWLLALGDMPYINPKTLSYMASEAKRGVIVAPVCEGRRGNPVVFGCKFKADLLALKGDVGAREIIKIYSSFVHQIHVDDKGVLYDIDRPKDVL